MKTTSILFALAVLSAAALAADKKVKCPVTKLSIQAKAAVGKEKVKGKTYYFCTTHCQKLFKKSPKKYLPKK